MENNKQPLLKSANDDLAGFTGSEGYHQFTADLVCTDGIRELAETCQCYWFLDIILSYQKSRNFKDQSFQVWTLKRITQHSFDVQATNGNQLILAEQHIPVSDFPYDTATAWLAYGVIMLPSEY